MDILYQLECENGTFWHDASWCSYFDVEVPRTVITSTLRQIERFVSLVHHLVPWIIYTSTFDSISWRTSSLASLWDTIQTQTLLKCCLWATSFSNIIDWSLWTQLRSQYTVELLSAIQIHASKKIVVNCLGCVSLASSHYPPCLSVSPTITEWLPLGAILCVCACVIYTGFLRHRSLIYSAVKKHLPLSDYFLYLHFIHWMLSDLQPKPNIR